MMLRRLLWTIALICAAASVRADDSLQHVIDGGVLDRKSVV